MRGPNRALVIIVADDIVTRCDKSLIAHTTTPKLMPIVDTPLDKSGSLTATTPLFVVASVETPVGQPTK